MKKSKFNYLNVGCGNRYNADWINIDIKSNSNDVIEHNILKGLPFQDHSMDVIYHSHVLEHLAAVHGATFLRECHRVLKDNGIIRIVVPDLERIIKEYTELTKDGFDKINFDRYNWIRLELFDQTMRNSTGGEMKEFILSQRESGYVMDRIGNEGAAIRKKEDQKKTLREKLYQIKRSLSELLNRIPFMRYYRAGKFRLSGEIHYCMYDQYSLSKVLKDIGFREVSVQTAFTSKVSGWKDFNLDSEDNRVLKPNSLFIEAVK